MVSISEFERNKPRQTFKQINKLIKLSKHLKKAIPELSVCKTQEGWVELSDKLNSLEEELKQLKITFKEGK